MYSSFLFAIAMAEVPISMSPFLQFRLSRYMDPSYLFPYSPSICFFTYGIAFEGENFVKFCKYLSGINLAL